MIHELDLEVVEGCFDRPTLARARAYVSNGAVLCADWDPDGERVSGSVRGSGALPYEVTVDLERTRNGRLVSVDGECTCPVGSDCTHAAALLLSTLQRPEPHATTPLPIPALGTSGTAATPRPEGPGGSPDLVIWDAFVDAFVGAGAIGRDAPRIDAPATVALQFELVTVAAGRGAPASLESQVDGPSRRIRVHPVVPGGSGNWVRSGVSWRTVDYLALGWGRLRCSATQLRVLKELRAVTTAGASRTSPYASAEEVWLDAVDSRRIWDLLAEAEDSGIPLVGASRRALRITLHRLEAQLSFDASAWPDAGGAGLSFRPRLTVGILAVPLGRAGCQPIGTPPHGIAWWDPPEAASPNAPGALSFARLPALPTAPWAALLSGAQVVVPEEDRERFFHAVYPRLSRHVRIESADGTVELPELPEESLILTLRHGEDHRLELTWWTGVPGTDWREVLEDPQRAVHGGPAARAASAWRQVLEHPAGRHLAPLGDRLEPQVSLQGMDTVRFLTDVLPDLEAIPGLVVEHTGEHPRYREAPEAPTVTLCETSDPGQDWFDLTVEVRVGGEQVPFVELFTALATGQSHMILPSGTYFSLEDPALRELAQLIEEARALHGADGDRIRVTRYQASLWTDLERLGVLSAQASEWERSVRALATASDRTVHPVPAGLDACLRPYQQVGFDWLVFLYELGLGGILADDMGLGKTLQVLALICHLREKDERGPGGKESQRGAQGEPSGQDAQGQGGEQGEPSGQDAQGRGGEQGGCDVPFLVVAPTSVVGTWASECRKFAPRLRIETVNATSRRRDRTLFDIAARADVVVTSYALFRLEYDDYEKQQWAGLVLDEAQFVKNVHSHGYQRAKTLPVRFKLAMTGTPMENHLMELWALLSITSPGLLGGAERFNEYYRQPIERRADEDKLALLRRRIKPLLLRRSKEQVAQDLPAKQEQVVELELGPQHRKLYQTYLQRERQKVLGLLDNVQRNRFQILQSLTVLRQASLSAGLVDPARQRVPSTKLDALMEMLEEVVADGHRVLVFSQFTRFLSMARERVRAAGIPHCYLDGRTTRRTAVLSEFRSGEVPVFLISLKAGGFGLNLTEADYCILLDPWWNPATEAQAVDRVHRMGQTRHVMVYRLVAKGTIEEKVMALKAKKAALFSSVIDSGGFESGALTAAEIRGLLD
jgi:superfamily II DNA or RNA helicase